MDRSIMRARAKAEYKKMMKGMPKHKRPSFTAVWPLIKAGLEAKASPTPNAAAELTVEDALAISDMMISEEPHVHGPNCNHDHENDPITIPV